MPHPQHLLYRNGWYYFHARVPVDLITHFGRKESCFSLKTKGPKSAQLLLLEVDEEV